MIAISKPPVIINAIENIVVFLRAQVLRVTYPKYFHNDTAGYEPQPFVDILGGTSTKIERRTTTWDLKTTYQSDTGTTKVLLINKFDPARPTLIYHHGAGDTQPLRDFRRIFPSEFIIGYNTFVIHAQNHTTRSDYLHHSVDSFLHHQETFAGSVLAVDEIIKYHRSNSKQPVVVTGVSMGGIVASLHAFFFGSADQYFSMVAYPNAGEVFLGNAYKTAVDDWADKRKQPGYINSFAISSFDPALTGKVFPILGSADRIVPFDQSFEFWNSRGFETKVFPYGHFTPGIVAKEIREYMTSRMKNITQPVAAHQQPHPALSSQERVM